MVVALNTALGGCDSKNASLMMLSVVMGAPTRGMMIFHWLGQESVEQPIMCYTNLLCMQWLEAIATDLAQCQHSCGSACNA